MALKIDGNEINIPKGLRAKNYAKFRKTARTGRVVVSTANEDEALYPATKNLTASGETEVLAAPGVGKAIRIKVMMVNNVGADQRVVSFLEGTGGTEKFKNSMPQYGSMWNLNFIGAYWTLPEATALVGNLDDVGDVNVQIGYEIVELADTKALEDRMGITEKLVYTHK